MQDTGVIFENYRPFGCVTVIILFNYEEFSLYEEKLREHP